jgi:hypothetical protein
LKPGVGCGSTASKNKKVTSRSTLLGICCMLDVLLAGPGGMGELLLQQGFLLLPPWPVVVARRWRGRMGRFWIQKGDLAPPAVAASD